MEPNEDDQARLEALSARFIQALRSKADGDLDTAEDELRAVLRAEPRLPEPHMELARVLLDTGRLEEAEVHGREALGYLEAGGQWTDEIPEPVVLALCNALLAEILRQRADQDDVIFGDPVAFRAMLDEARERFETAARLDPRDEYSSFHAFFLGPVGGTPEA
ncbi:MAG: tetratricopeptide (TPR) repeat protein [Myxococcota bacterium]|jgi:tetratricopeptide (TPR) repeat protein